MAHAISCTVLSTGRGGFEAPSTNCSPVAFEHAAGLAFEHAMPCHAMLCHVSFPQMFQTRNLVDSHNRGTTTDRPAATCTAGWYGYLAGWYAPGAPASYSSPSLPPRLPKPKQFLTSRSHFARCLVCSSITILRSSQAVQLKTE